MQTEDAPPLVFRRPVTLVGAGALARAVLEEALAIAPEIVAADGGADLLAGWSVEPAAVIGDMDSIADPGRWQGRKTRFLRIAEQETTDFGKCLDATEAPFYIGVGFTGGQVDHMLAALHAILKHPEKTVVLLGEEDAIAAVPPGRVIGLDLNPGARVSLSPLAPITGTHSLGLKWPIEGLTLTPGGRGGTSNVATVPRVEIGFDRPGALILLERRYLDALVRALTTASDPCRLPTDSGSA